MAIQEAIKAKGVQETSLGLRKHVQEFDQILSGVANGPVSVPSFVVKGTLCPLRQSTPLESIIRGAKTHLIRATHCEKGRLGGLPLHSAFPALMLVANQTTVQHHPGCGSSQSLVVLNPKRFNFVDLARAKRHRTEKVRS